MSTTSKRSLHSHSIAEKVSLDLGGLKGSRNVLEGMIGHKKAKIQTKDM
jgi:hypothetical protein